MINFDNVNDEIGKLIVIIIISPIIIYKSFIFEDLLLGVIGVLLFIYDFYWFYQYNKLSNKNKKKDMNSSDKINNNDYKKSKDNGN